jgi:hypothetical protein
MLDDDIAILCILDRTSTVEETDANDDSMVTTSDDVCSSRGTAAGRIAIVQVTPPPT